MFFSVSKFVLLFFDIRSSLRLMSFLIFSGLLAIESGIFVTWGLSNPVGIVVFLAGKKASLDSLLNFNTGNTEKAEITPRTITQTRKVNQDNKKVSKSPSPFSRRPGKNAIVKIVKPPEPKKFSQKDDFLAELEKELDSLSNDYFNESEFIIP